MVFDQKKKNVLIVNFIKILSQKILLGLDSDPNWIRIQQNTWIRILRLLYKVNDACYSKTVYKSRALKTNP